MTASVKISEQQTAFAQLLVEQGRYDSVDAVVQHALDLLQIDAELKDAELAALRSLLADRARGPMVPLDAARRDTEAMIAAKRRAHGL